MAKINLKIILLCEILLKDMKKLRKTTLSVPSIIELV